MQTVEQEQLAIEGGPRTVNYKFPTNSDISDACSATKRLPN